MPRLGRAVPVDSRILYAGSRGKEAQICRSLAKRPGRRNTREEGRVKVPEAPAFNKSKAMTEVLEDIELFDVDEATHEVKIEPTARRIRGFFDGVPVVDSKRAMLMFESGRIGIYYFPIEDVRMDLLAPSAKTTESPYKGRASYFSIKTKDRVAEDAAWRYAEPPAGCPDIRGLVAFYWNEMDAWFEEDEEVFGHARDPYHRIDILESSRHVKVVVEGETLADSTHPRLLFESGLPTRFYLPKIDVKMHLLTPSETVTVCAYKGVASAYWSYAVADKVIKDVAWSYPNTTLEASKIANLICFFNERADIYVDGEPEGRPATQWSDPDAV